MAERKASSTSAPYLLPSGAAPQLDAEATVREAKVPPAALCHLDLAAEVTAPDAFGESILVQPLEAGSLVGIRPSTVRSFRWDADSGTFSPVWHSGVNVGLGQAW